MTPDSVAGAISTPEDSTIKTDGEAPEHKGGGGNPLSSFVGLLKRQQSWILWVLGFISFVVVWWTIALLVNKPYLPTPAEVLVALWDSFTVSSFYDPRLMHEHIGASLHRVGWGFLMALLCAAPIGYLAGYSQRVEQFISPAIELIRPIPPIAWLPFAIVFFTARDFPAAAVFIIFLGIFFPVLTNTIDGVKSIDKLLYDAALTLGAKRRDIFRKVILPASLPNMMTGIRIGIGVGWMTIVAAEMTPVFSEGLGWYIWNRAEVFKYDEMFAGMLMIGIIGLVMTKSISYTERWLRR